VNEEQGKQGKLDFTYTYEAKDMGTLLSPHAIYLFESFIRKQLEGSRLDATPFNEEKTTKVGCPFCKNGFLILVKVEPEYKCGVYETPH